MEKSRSSTGRPSPPRTLQIIAPGQVNTQAFPVVLSRMFAAFFRSLAMAAVCVVRQLTTPTHTPPGTPFTFIPWGGPQPVTVHEQPVPTKLISAFPKVPVDIATATFRYTMGVPGHAGWGRTSLAQSNRNEIAMPSRILLQRADGRWTIGLWVEVLSSKNIRLPLCLTARALRMFPRLNQLALSASKCPMSIP